MVAHLVSILDVRDFGAETVRIGDLNGDGAPDLLFVQNQYGTRAITCLTATTITGERLWQHGTPSPDNGFIYSDLPVQIHDWDCDGHAEVLYVQQARYAELHPGTGYAVERASRYEGDATLIVLDACSGREKSRLPLPAPADDCFLFADLTGRGWRSDLVVKDRYWNMWGIRHDGRLLWHWEGSPGHFPVIGDVDNDGCDEVFVGFALVDHDGRVLFSHNPQGQHQDAACAVRLYDGSWRLLFGNHGLHCLEASGRELWFHPLAEAQHVVPGRFRADAELQFMVVDRGQPGSDGRRLPATLLLYDLDGHELWRRPQPAGSWCTACVKLGWFGPGQLDTALLYGRSPIITVPRGQERLYGCTSETPDAIYDGSGTELECLPLRYTPERAAESQRWSHHALGADVWGDSREEVVLFGARGACIYANAAPASVPSLYNETLYPGE